MRKTILIIGIAMFGLGLAGLLLHVFESEAYYVWGVGMILTLGSIVRWNS